MTRDFVRFLLVLPDDIPAHPVRGGHGVRSSGAQCSGEPVSVEGAEGADFAGGAACADVFEAEAGGWAGAAAPDLSNRNLGIAARRRRLDSDADVAQMHQNPATISCCQPARSRRFSGRTGSADTGCGGRWLMTLGPGGLRVFQKIAITRRSHLRPRAVATVCPGNARASPAGVPWSKRTAIAAADSGRLSATKSRRRQSVPVFRTASSLLQCSGLRGFSHSRSPPEPRATDAPMPRQPCQGSSTAGQSDQSSVANCLDHGETLTQSAAVITCGLRPCLRLHGQAPRSAGKPPLPDRPEPGAPPIAPTTATCEYPAQSMGERTHGASVALEEHYTVPRIFPPLRPTRSPAAGFPVLFPWSGRLPPSATKLR